VNADRSRDTLSFFPLCELSTVTVVFTIYRFELPRHEAHSFTHLPDNMAPLHNNYAIPAQRY